MDTFTGILMTRKVCLYLLDHRRFFYEKDSVDPHDNPSTFDEVQEKQLLTADFYIRKCREMFSVKEFYVKKM